MCVLVIVVCVFAISTVCHGAFVSGDAGKMTTWQNSLEVVSENGSAQGCGGLLTSRHGHLISPQFPASLPPSYTECSWVVKGPLHTVVRFRFLVVYLPPPSPVAGDCLDGYVSYGQYDYNGRQVTQHRFCGTEFPHLYVSPGRWAWLTFVSTGTAMHPDLYKGIKVVYTIIDTDFIQNQLAVGIVGGLVVPLSCIVAMCYYVRKINRRKQRAEKETDHLRILKYRANDERLERRRVSQLSVPTATVNPEESDGDDKRSPPNVTNEMDANKAENEMGEDSQDINNNRMGYSTFLRHILESQSTDMSRDTTEASTATNCSSAMSTTLDHWPPPRRTLAPRPTLAPIPSVDSVYLLPPSVQSLAPGSSLQPLWGDSPSPYYVTGGAPWEEREVYFAPVDGTTAYSDKPSVPENVRQLNSDMRGFRRGVDARCRVYMETMC